MTKVIRTVLGRSRARSDRLRSGIYPATLPLAPSDETGFKLYHQYRGSTPNVDSFSCHISALAQGHCPHPPHVHPEEEILIMLQGEADIVLPRCPAEERRLRAGEFVYYPARFPHTLRAVSEHPANYLMFKWRASYRGGAARLGFQHVDLDTVHATGTGSRGFESRLLFEGPTECVGKLHAHLSFLAPGAGYDPHVDAHDGVVVLFAGNIESLGHRIRPHGIVHFAAGEPHGIRNPGSHPARYLVFEFHGRPPLLRKLGDPARWRRKLLSLWAAARTGPPR